AHMQADDVALLEKRLLVRGRGVAFDARLYHRGLARKELNLHAEGLAVAGNDAADPAVTENAERLAAQSRADAELPMARLQRGHLLRNLPRGGEDQPPGQFRGGVARRAGVLAGRDDDAALRACIDVDVRINAALADELELGQALEQRLADLRPLADQHQDVGIFQPIGEDVDVLNVVVPDFDIETVELAKTVERSDRVEIVVETGNLHGAFTSP